MVDKDLLSIQEARALVRAARAAQADFSQLGQERIDAVVKAVAEAAAAQAEALGVLAHEETDTVSRRTRRSRIFSPVKRFMRPLRI